MPSRCDVAAARTIGVSHMPSAITSAAAFHAAASSAIEDQIRKDTTGIDPAVIEEIVSLVLKYGPSIYAAILSLFHITPKKG